MAGCNLLGTFNVTFYGAQFKLPMKLVWLKKTHTHTENRRENKNYRKVGKGFVKLFQNTGSTL